MEVDALGEHDLCCRHVSRLPSLSSIGALTVDGPSRFLIQDGLLDYDTRNFRSSASEKARGENATGN